MTALICDSFAGGGGASTGIEMALGRSPDYAINHDEVALGLHETNHPDTVHLSKNIWQVDPLDVIGRRRVGLAWFSPDCKHFSKAKGGKPVEKHIRDLAWIVVLWAQRVRPEVIILENVEEFRTWGPLGEDGRPCPDHQGKTFKKWVGQLRREGYRVEHRELKACDYGAPTIRKRLFVIARCDGKPIVWPEPTHGDPESANVKAGRLKPWRAAADIIDWSVPCPSIFDTSEAIKEKFGIRAIRPLADATLRRIARGVVRYVLDAKRPFLVSVAHGDSGGHRTADLHAPAPTVVQKGSHAVVAPVVAYQQQGGGARDAGQPLHTICASKKDQNQFLAATMVQTGYGERPGQAPRAIDLDQPIGTQVAGGAKHGVVAAFMAQHNAGPRNGSISGRPTSAPLSTVTMRGTQQQLVATHLLNMRGSDRRDAGADTPLSTQTAGGNHAALVASFLTAYYGTEQTGDLTQPIGAATTRDRHGLVTVEIDGQSYAIVDIGMRMLTPRERFRAQGFPDDYVIDRLPDGRAISVTKQGEVCGNSVCPPVAAALVRENCGHLAKVEVAA